MRSSILLYLIYYFSYPNENTITHTYFHPIRDVVRTIVNLSDARNIKGIHYEFLQAHWKYTSILCLSLSFAPVCNVLVHMKGQEMWWGHSNSVLRCVWRIRASWMCFNFNIIKTSLYKNIYKNKIGVQMQFLFAWLAGTDSSILRQKKIYQIMCRHEEKKKASSSKDKQHGSKIQQKHKNYPPNWPSTYTNTLTCTYQVYMVHEPNNSFIPQLAFSPISLSFIIKSCFSCACTVYTMCTSADLLLAQFTVRSKANRFNSARCRVQAVEWSSMYTLKSEFGWYRCKTIGYQL